MLQPCLVIRDIYTTIQEVRDAVVVWSLLLYTIHSVVDDIESSRSCCQKLRLLEVKHVLLPSRVSYRL